MASRLDPVVFKATDGRFFSMGKAAMPMVTLTTRGAGAGDRGPCTWPPSRRTAWPTWWRVPWGRPGIAGWSHNLEADSAVEVQAEGERYRAKAERLSDQEKAALWPQVKAEIPQMNVYEERTDRNIRVYRLRRV